MYPTTCLHPFLPDKNDAYATLPQHRETPGLSSKPRNFFIGQIRLNRHRTQTRQFILKTVKSADISLRDRDDLLKLFDRLIKVGRLGRCDFQCVDRIIGGQNFPILSMMMPRRGG